jgi:hypothetical protein
MRILQHIKGKLIVIGRRMRRHCSCKLNVMIDCLIWAIKEESFLINESSDSEFTKLGSNYEVIRPAPRHSRRYALRTRSLSLSLSLSLSNSIEASEVEIKVHNFHRKLFMSWESIKCRSLPPNEDPLDPSILLLAKNSTHNWLRLSFSTLALCRERDEFLQLNYTL